MQLSQKKKKKLRESSLKTNKRLSPTDTGWNRAIGHHSKSSNFSFNARDDFGIDL